jgi:hypothetical protein
MYVKFNAQNRQDATSNIKPDGEEGLAFEKCDDSLMDFRLIKDGGTIRAMTAAEREEEVQYLDSVAKAQAAAA